MSDERFFEQFKNTLSNYAPEVPQAAYGKMRRALWWSNFTRLSLTRFNMWYLIALLGVGGGALALMSGENTAQREAAMAPVFSPEVSTLPGMSIASTNQTTVGCNPLQNCQSASGIVCAMPQHNAANNVSIDPNLLTETHENALGSEAQTGAPEVASPPAEETSAIVESKPSELSTEKSAEVKKDVRTKKYKVKTYNQEAAQKKTNKK